MTARIERCEHCDAKMIHYRHSLNKGLAKGLIILDKKYGGIASLNEMKELNFNQKNNFQKLRYWGLVKKGEDCRWQITEEGLRFVKGEEIVPKIVITYRNQFEKFDGPLIGIETALQEYGYWWREQYLENRA